MPPNAGSAASADPTAFTELPQRIAKPGRGPHHTVFQPRRRPDRPPGSRARSPDHTAATASVRMARAISGVADRHSAPVPATSASGTIWSRIKPISPGRRSIGHGAPRLGIFACTGLIHRKRGATDQTASLPQGHATHNLERCVTKATLTDLLAPDAARPRPRRRSCCKAGGLVAFPTETVYGLGGDARAMTAPWRGFSRPRAGQASTPSSSMSPISRPQQA